MAELNRLLLHLLNDLNLIHFYFQSHSHGNNLIDTFSSMTQETRSSMNNVTTHDTHQINSNSNHDENVKNTHLHQDTESQNEIIVQKDPGTQHVQTLTGLIFDLKWFQQELNHPILTCQIINDHLSKILLSMILHQQKSSSHLHNHTQFTSQNHHHHGVFPHLLGLPSSLIFEQDLPRYFSSSSYSSTLRFFDTDVFHQDDHQKGTYHSHDLKIHPVHCFSHCLPSLSEIELLLFRPESHCEIHRNHDTCMSQFHSRQARIKVFTLSDLDWILAQQDSDSLLQEGGFSSLSDLSNTNTEILNILVLSSTQENHSDSSENRSLKTKFKDQTCLPRFHFLFKNETDLISALSSPLFKQITEPIHQNWVGRQVLKKIIHQTEESISSYLSNSKSLNKWLYQFESSMLKSIIEPHISDLHCDACMNDVSQPESTTIPTTFTSFLNQNIHENINAQESASENFSELLGLLYFGNMIDALSRSLDTFLHLYQKFDPTLFNDQYCMEIFDFLNSDLNSLLDRDEITGLNNLQDHVAVDLTSTEKHTIWDLLFENIIFTLKELREIISLLLKKPSIKNSEGPSTATTAQGECASTLHDHSDLDRESNERLSCLRLFLEQKDIHQSLNRLASHKHSAISRALYLYFAQRLKFKEKTTVGNIDEEKVTEHLKCLKENLFSKLLTFISFIENLKALNSNGNHTSATPDDDISNNVYHGSDPGTPSSTFSSTSSSMNTMSSNFTTLFFSSFQVLLRIGMATSKAYIALTTMRLEASPRMLQLAPSVRVLQSIQSWVFSSHQHRFPFHDVHDHGVRDAISTLFSVSMPIQTANQHAYAFTSDNFPFLSAFPWSDMLKKVLSLYESPCSLNLRQQQTFAFCDRVLEEYFRISNPQLEELVETLSPILEEGKHICEHEIKSMTWLQESIHEKRLCLESMTSSTNPSPYLNLNFPMPGQSFYEFDKNCFTPLLWNVPEFVGSVSLFQVPLVQISEITSENHRDSISNLTTSIQRQLNIAASESGQHLEKTDRDSHLKRFIVIKKFDPIAYKSSSSKPLQLGEEVVADCVESNAHSVLVYRIETPSEQFLVPLSYLRERRGVQTHGPGDPSSQSSVTSQMKAGDGNRLNERTALPKLISVQEKFVKELQNLNFNHIDSISSPTTRFLLSCADWKTKILENANEILQAMIAKTCTGINEFKDFVGFTCWAEWVFAYQDHLFILSWLVEHHKELLHSSLCQEIVKLLATVSDYANHMSFIWNCIHIPNYNSVLRKLQNIMNEINRITTKLNNTHQTSNEYLMFSLFSIGTDYIYLDTEFARFLLTECNKLSNHFGHLEMSVASQINLAGCALRAQSLKESENRFSDAASMLENLSGFIKLQDLFAQYIRMGLSLVNVVCESQSTSGSLSDTWIHEVGNPEFDSVGNGVLFACMAQLKNTENTAMMWSKFKFGWCSHLSSITNLSLAQSAIGSGQFIFAKYILDEMDKTTDKIPKHRSIPNELVLLREEMSAFLSEKFSFDLKCLVWMTRNFSMESQCLLNKFQLLKQIVIRQKNNSPRRIPTVSGSVSRLSWNTIYVAIQDSSSFPTDTAGLQHVQFSKGQILEYIGHSNEQGKFMYMKNMNTEQVGTFPKSDVHTSLAPLINGHLGTGIFFEDNTLNLLSKLNSCIDLDSFLSLDNPSNSISADEHEDHISYALQSKLEKLEAIEAESIIKEEKQTLPTKNISLILQQRDEQCEKNLQRILNYGFQEQSSVFHSSVFHSDQSELIRKLTSFYSNGKKRTPEESRKNSPGSETPSYSILHHCITSLAWMEFDDKFAENLSCKILSIEQSPKQDSWITSLLLKTISSYCDCWNICTNCFFTHIASVNSYDFENYESIISCCPHRKPVNSNSEIKLRDTPILNSTHSAEAGILKHSMLTDKQCKDQHNSMIYNLDRNIAQQSSNEFKIRTDSRKDRPANLEEKTKVLQSLKQQLDKMPVDVLLKFANEFDAQLHPRRTHFLDASSDLDLPPYDPSTM